MELDKLSVSGSSARPGEQDTTRVQRILTLAEAARLLRFSRSHLSNILNGRVSGLPHLHRVRVGRRVLLRREALEDWLREVERVTTP